MQYNIYRLELILIVLILRSNLLRRFHTSIQHIIFSLIFSFNEIKPVKRLGITLNKLTWSPHIDYCLCMRFSRVIYLLKELQFIFSNYHLKNAHCALFNDIFLWNSYLRQFSGIFESASVVSG